MLPGLWTAFLTFFIPCPVFGYPFSAISYLPCLSPNFGRGTSVPTHPFLSDPHDPAPHNKKFVWGAPHTPHNILFVPTETFGCFRFPHTIFPLSPQIILLRFFLKKRSPLCEKTVPTENICFPHTKSGLQFSPHKLRQVLVHPHTKFRPCVGH